MQPLRHAGLLLAFLVFALPGAQANPLLPQLPLDLPVDEGEGEDGSAGTICLGYYWPPRPPFVQVYEANCRAMADYYVGEVLDLATCQAPTNPGQCLPEVEPYTVCTPDGACYPCDVPIHPRMCTNPPRDGSSEIDLDSVVPQLVGPSSDEA